MDILTFQYIVFGSVCIPNEIFDSLIWFEDFSLFTSEEKFCLFRIEETN